MIPTLESVNTALRRVYLTEKRVDATITFEYIYSRTLQTGQIVYIQWMISIGRIQNSNFESLHSTHWKLCKWTWASLSAFSVCVSIGYFEFQSKFHAVKCAHRMDLCFREGLTHTRSPYILIKIHFPNRFPWRRQSFKIKFQTNRSSSSSNPSLFSLGSTQTFVLI